MCTFNYSFAGVTMMRFFTIRLEAAFCVTTDNRKENRNSRKIGKIGVSEFRVNSLMRLKGFANKRDLLKRKEGGAG